MHVREDGRLFHVGNQAMDRYQAASLFGLAVSKRKKII